jgi:hypothetical protein
VRILFDDGELAARCNGPSSWPGDASDDVRVALLVLQESQNLEAFVALPNTRKERDEIVFEGRDSAVVLIARQETLAVVVQAVTIRRLTSTK